MAQKSNIRSMRFSNEIIQMIESQAGETFTAKFEALVQRCMWELPRKEQELKNLQETINHERERLNNIRKKTMEIENNAYRLNSLLQGYCTNVQYTVKGIEQLIDQE